jgi:hypothetical protein
MDLKGRRWGRLRVARRGSLLTQLDPQPLMLNGREALMRRARQTPDAGVSLIASSPSWTP